MCSLYSSKFLSILSQKTLCICSIFVPQYAEKSWKELTTWKTSEIRTIEAFLDSPVDNGIICCLRSSWESDRSGFVSASGSCERNKNKQVKLIDVVLTSITEYTFCISCNL